MVSNEEQSNIKHFQIYIDQRTEKYKTKGTSNSLAYPMFGYVLLSKVLSCYLATQSLHLDETTAGQNLSQRTKTRYLPLPRVTQR